MSNRLILRMKFSSEDQDPGKELKAITWHFTTAIILLVATIILFLIMLARLQ